MAPPVKVFDKKETLAQVLSCEFFKISNNTFFTPLDDCFYTYRETILVHPKSRILIVFKMYFKLILPLILLS